MTFSLITVAAVAMIYSLSKRDYDKQSRYLTIVIALIVVGLSAILEFRFRVENPILLSLGVIVIFMVHFRALKRQRK